MNSEQHKVQGHGPQAAEDCHSKATSQQGSELQIWNKAVLSKPQTEIGGQSPRGIERPTGRDWKTRGHGPQQIKWLQAGHRLKERLLANDLGC